MAFVVEMWGLPVAEDPQARRNNRFFQCHAKFWEEILKLGRENGWQPMGTIPANEGSLKNYIQNGKFDSSYEPDEYSYAKGVLAEDARAWAVALEKATNRVGAERLENKENWPVLLRDDMTEDDLIDANRGMAGKHVREFIEFLRKGGFGFAWDD